MSLKTMLIPTEQRTSMSSTLETALLLAHRFDGYIEGFALQPALSELLTVDMAGSFAPKSFKQDRVEDAQKSKAIFEAFMSEHDVPRSDPATSGLCFGWLDDAPEGEKSVGSYGRVFDLIVFSRPDPTSFGLDTRVLRIRPVRERQTDQMPPTSSARHTAHARRPTQWQSTIRSNAQIRPAAPDPTPPEYGGRSHHRRSALALDAVCCPIQPNRHGQTGRATY